LETLQRLTETDALQVIEKDGASRRNYISLAIS
jgi:hypothetical protein